MEKGHKLEKIIMSDIKLNFPLQHVLLSDNIDKVKRIIVII